MAVTYDWVISQLRAMGATDGPSIQRAMLALRTPDGQPIPTDVKTIIGSAAAAVDRGRYSNLETAVVNNSRANPALLGSLGTTVAPLGQTTTAATTVAPTTSPINLGGSSWIQNTVANIVAETNPAALPLLAPTRPVAALPAYTPPPAPGAAPVLPSYVAPSALASQESGAIGAASISSQMQAQSATRGALTNTRLPQMTQAQWNQLQSRLPEEDRTSYSAYLAARRGEIPAPAANAPAAQSYIPAPGSGAPMPTGGSTVLTPPPVVSTTPATPAVTPVTPATPVTPVTPVVPPVTPAATTPSGVTPTFAGSPEQLQEMLRKQGELQAGMAEAQAEAVRRSREAQAQAELERRGAARASYFAGQAAKAALGARGLSFSPGLGAAQARASMAAGERQRLGVERQLSAQQQAIGSLLSSSIQDYLKQGQANLDNATRVTNIVSGLKGTR